MGRSRADCQLELQRLSLRCCCDPAGPAAADKRLKSSNVIPRTLEIGAGLRSRAELTDGVGRELACAQQQKQQLRSTLKQDLIA